MTQKSLRRVGIDMSILDRTETGTSVYARNLFNALTAVDQSEYEFIALHGPKPLKSKNIVAKFANFLLEILWLYLLLPLQARRKQLDLVHMPANIISPLLRRTPQVCTIHDAHFMTNPQGRDPLWLRYAQFSFRYAASHASRIICVSQSASEEVVDLLGADPANIDIVYHGLPERDADPVDEAVAEGYRPYILSVGKTNPNKNLARLVDAFALIKNNEETGDLRLIIAGPPGPSHQMLEDIIVRHGLGEHVLLTGLVSDSMLASLYKHATVFAFPSHCEGFGFPPLEAMHYGIPVVASTAPCIPETLDDAPLYFDPDNVREMAARIEEVLLDEPLRKRLVEAGRRRAGRFTWEETAQKTVSVYRSLI